MLIFIPNSKISRILASSIVPFIILTSAYIYVAHQAILLKEDLFSIFHLYLSIDNLYTVFSTENFLLIFWLHFIAFNLFMGGWVSRDGIRFNIPRWLMGFILLLIYFVGPVGFLFYWLIRIFYAKKINLHE